MLAAMRYACGSLFDLISAAGKAAEAGMGDKPDGPEIALPEPDLNPLVALATSLMASQSYSAVMLSC